MPGIPRYDRRPLMALVAIFATSLASEASACSTMKASPAACATVCGCCSPETSEAPPSHPEAARVATMPRAPMACQSAPAEGCSCRSQEPAAPSPKPARGTAEGRPAPSQGSDLVCLGDEAAARDRLFPQVAPTQSPPKIPLYLRNARLLF